MASIGRIVGQENSALGRPEFFRELGMVFGTRYESSAVLADSLDAPRAAWNPVTDFIPTAFPGCRTPHVWLELDRERTSTLDLFGPWFTAIVVGEETFPDPGAVPLRVVRVEQSTEVANVYGLAPGNCVLVRPDGYVAWRGPTQEAAVAFCP